MRSLTPEDLREAARKYLSPEAFWGGDCPSWLIWRRVGGYYEIETEIPANHELRLNLPKEIPPGNVNVAIIHDQQESPKLESNNWLEVLGAGQAYSRFKSTEDVNRFIREQREV